MLTVAPARPITESGIGFQPASKLAAPSAFWVWKYVLAMTQAKAGCPQ